jgi:hypothetical protein
MEKIKSTVRKEEYYFRIIGLIPSLAELFEKEVIVTNFAKKLNKDTNCFVVSFPITERIDQEKVFNFLKNNKISEVSYGFFASLTTKNDIDGLEFPEYVVRFHKLVGGNIDVSVIYSG